MDKETKIRTGIADYKQLTKSVSDSAQQIWLAGLGALAKAQTEGSNVFDALVKEGQIVQSKTQKVAESMVTEMPTSLNTMANNQATGILSKLEQVVEDRVACVLKRIGVATTKDIEDLSKRIEEYAASVQK